MAYSLEIYLKKKPSPKGKVGGFIYSLPLFIMIIMPEKKLNYKKEFPDLYNPSKSIHIFDVPSMNFYMIDGKGDPNTSEEFKDAIQALYACSYTLKMGYKKKHPTRDYVVPPLEGLWFMEDMTKWTAENKSDWKWTLLIRIPDYITEKEAVEAIKTARIKKGLDIIDKVRWETYQEGKVVQVLYIGAYKDEHPTIMAMHDFAKKGGFQLRGKHHEIYLSDPRKVDPAKQRTVLRQPIE
jgi:hypothetical protein